MLLPFSIKADYQHGFREHDDLSRFAETSSLNGPRTVLLPENADVVKRIIHGLYAARHKPDILPEPSLELLHAHVMFHQKYNIKVSRFAAESALTAALRKDSFAGIAYASRLDDLTLGRQAIELLRFDPVHKGRGIRPLGRDGGHKAKLATRPC